MTETVDDDGWSRQARMGNHRGQSKPLNAPSRESEPDVTGQKTGQLTDIQRLASAVSTARQDGEMSHSAVLELLEETCAQKRAKYLELADTFHWSELEAEIRDADRQLGKAIHEPIRSTADQFAIECVAHLFEACTRVVRADSTISFEFVGDFGNRVFEVAGTLLRLKQSDSESVFTIACRDTVEAIEDALRAIYERPQ